MVTAAEPGVAFGAQLVHGAPTSGWWRSSSAWPMMGSCLRRQRALQQRIEVVVPLRLTIQVEVGAVTAAFLLGADEFEPLVDPGCFMGPRT